jgi:hypothetical protein
VAPARAAATESAPVYAHVGEEAHVQRSQRVDLERDAELAHHELFRRRLAEDLFLG